MVFADEVFLLWLLMPCYSSVYRTSYFDKSRLSRESKGFLYIRQGLFVYHGLHFLEAHSVSYKHIS